MRERLLSFFLLLLASREEKSHAWTPRPTAESSPPTVNSVTLHVVDAVSRRDAVSWLLMSVPSFLTMSSRAVAFDNKISNKYDDRPKRRGPKPTDLGVGPRKSLEDNVLYTLDSSRAVPLQTAFPRRYQTTKTTPFPLGSGLWATIKNVLFKT
jgi:hypothetical protein